MDARGIAALPTCSVALFELLQPPAQFPMPVLLHFELVNQISAEASLVPVVVTVHVPFALTNPFACVPLLQPVPKFSVQNCALQIVTDKSEKMSSSFFIG